MRLRIIVITLAVGLGIVGILSADEAGGFFSRWFTPAADKTVKIEPAKEESPKMPPSASLSRKRQAQADLERRQEVCDKLREIAIAVGDEETLRKVDQLEQRAWDLYVAATNSRSDVVRVKADVVEKKGGR